LGSARLFNLNGEIELAKELIHKHGLNLARDVKSGRKGMRKELGFTGCGKTKFFEGDGLQAVH
jgi:hypothetical protein